MDGARGGASDGLALGESLEKLAEGLIDSLVLQRVHRHFWEANDPA